MATITRQALRTRIGRDEAWMRFAPGAPDTASSTSTAEGNAGGTTIIDTSIYSSAIDQLVRQRSVICITSGDERGSRSYATGPPTTAGVITVSPAFSGQIDASVTYEVWDPDGPHPDIIDRMIDKALTEDCWRWLPMPITSLRGGDVGEDLTITADDLLQDGTVVWTGDGNVTLTLQDQSVPDEFVRRVIRIVSTAGDGGIESNPIECDPTNRGEWRIEALCRSMATAAGAAGGTGNGTELKLVDKTNGDADIAPTTALSTVNRGWTLLASDFTLPATCYQLAVQLNVETSGEVGEFAWIQLWQKNQKRISLPQRIVAKKHVGSTFVRVGTIFDNFARAPWQGALERREVGGTGVQLELEPEMGTHALWFYERDAFPTLTTATPADTDDDATTWAADLWLRAAVTWELYRWLSQRDRKTEQGVPEGADQPIQRGWRQAEQQALEVLLAMQAEYGAQPQVVEDAASPAHAATRPVN